MYNIKKYAGLLGCEFQHDKPHGGVTMLYQLFVLNAEAQ
jgi:hypothetical protein